MSEVRALEPKSLWNYFSDLNAVPRPSKKEERVIAFMKNFGESLNLKTEVDETGNVIIRKPASPGMENRKSVVLQSHLDMVHQKNNDTTFDFDTQGIEMRVDGDWVKAKGTTLGADNGIGVASIMAILASDTIKHPPIEALFTIDEETGMTGAIGLKENVLQGDIMLNLDTEDDRELTIGCAGGVNFTAIWIYLQEDIHEGHEKALLSIKGLTGGHSGMDIHRGRGNANKLMNRILKKLVKEHDACISSINGGGLRNAIPRESAAVITFPKQAKAEVERTLETMRTILKVEYGTTDPNLQITMEPTREGYSVMDAAEAMKFLNAVYTCHNGIFRMSPDIDGLVQTSNNIASIRVAEGSVSINCLVRSAVESEKDELTETLRSNFELLRSKITLSASYPGWMPKPDAEIVRIMTKLYQEQFKTEPMVNACHAGLECGILGQNYPDMEMISFGPNIHGAHSPDEKVQVSSVQKFWGFLLSTLENIPVK